MNYTSILGLPLRVFWTLNTQINRLRAEEHLDWLELIMLTHQGATTEMFESVRTGLQNRMGTPMVVTDAAVDELNAHREAINKLKSFLGAN